MGKWVVYPKLIIFTCVFTVQSTFCNVGYRVASICLCVDTDGLHTQRRCSVIKHIYSKQNNIWFNQCVPVINDFRFRSALVNWSGVSLVAIFRGWVYIIFNCWVNGWNHITVTWYESHGVSNPLKLVCLLNLARFTTMKINAPRYSSFVFPPPHWPLAVTGDFYLLKGQ